MIQATFKLANKDSTATCFLLTRAIPSNPSKKELLLVTAGHVLDRTTGDLATLVLRKKRDDGTWVRDELAVAIRTGGRPLWTKNPDVDVAVLQLNLAATAFPALPVSALASEADVKAGKLATGDDLYVACYPVQFEANTHGFPVVRRGSVAGYPLTPVKTYKTFLVDYNSFAGDSGGPVFLADPAAKGKDGPAQPLIVGLILGQHQQDERTKLTYEERVLHHRLGLAIAVHADYIRQTIDLLPK
jgi:hypothetical protein